MKYVSRDKLVKMIKATNGSIFSVLFSKTRSNGELRRMNCMLNCKKHLVGTGKAAPESAQLITVYDLTNKGYRSIAIEGLVQAQIGKEVYEVTDVATV
jgi:hypothetical protein